MTDSILKTLPLRRGHFLLESGYHTDLWFTLDALFVAPHEITPLVSALAERIQPYDVSAICGPLLGGAFLAHALASQMRLRFYFTQRADSNSDEFLLAAKYRLPSELCERVFGERVAIVDDCISAGSSVRATMDELTSAGASTVVVGSILLLGNRAVEHFRASGIPLVTLAQREFNLWTPDLCPCCRDRVPLEDPVIQTRA